ncbi:MAG TPA: hypothetical protein VMU15_11125 [Anaeromyxobacter sp.]|nr:hypothetical protein [Anaeromyxobacter sp.]
MDRLLAAAVLALGVGPLGCGGGGGSGPSFKDPNSVRFSYGTPYVPAGGSAEASAAAAGESGVGSSSAIQVQGDGDDQAAGEVAGLPNAMAEAAFGWSGGLARSVEVARASVGRRAAAYLAGDVAAASGGWDNDLCWTVDAQSITFEHCTQTSTDGTAHELLSVDGALHRVDGHVWWDVTVGLQASDTSVPSSVTVSDRLRGDLTFGAGTLDGFEQSDIYLRESSQAQSATAALTYRADFDAITYTTDAGVCATGVTGGTLTLKRVWTTVPSGTDLDPGTLTDVALRFSWSGCGVIQVAEGTPAP